jgi:hypothetical protein
MASTPQTLFSPTVTSDFDWAVGSWAHAGIVGGVLAAAAAAVALAVRTVRRSRATAAARRAAALDAGESPDEGLDVYTVYVTAMAMALSINGMWHVFTETMHLPWIVRLVACSVLESAGLAFMRLARKDILAKRPATRHVVIVWGIALLSGGLSAGASKSLLEGVIRVSLPLLAVQLCHAWMLPLPTEVTLTQHELGKRAWRYVKATRRLARSGNRVTRYIATKRLHLESDLLTKRSLMTGDATSVLRAAEQMATNEAFAGLGLAPATGPGQLRMGGSDGSTQPVTIRISDPSEDQPSEITDGSVPALAPAASWPSEVSDGFAPIPAAASWPSEVSGGSVPDSVGRPDGSGNLAPMGAAYGSALAPTRLDGGYTPVLPEPEDAATSAVTGQDEPYGQEWSEGQGEAAGLIPAQPTHPDLTHPDRSDGYFQAAAPIHNGTHPFVADFSSAPRNDASDGSSDGFSDGQAPIRTAQPIGAATHPSQPTAQRLTVSVDQDPSEDPSENGRTSGRRRSIEELYEAAQQLPPPVPTTADGLKDALGIGLTKARAVRDLLTTTGDQS